MKNLIIFGMLLFQLFVVARSSAAVVGCLSGGTLYYNKLGTSPLGYPIFDNATGYTVNVNSNNVNVCDQIDDVSGRSNLTTAKRTCYINGSNTFIGASFGTSVERYTLNPCPLDDYIYVFLALSCGVGYLVLARKKALGC